MEGSSSSDLCNETTERSEPRNTIDAQPQSQIAGGLVDAGQSQDAQNPSCQHVTTSTTDQPATPSQAVDELEQDPSGSAPQSPTKYCDALEEHNSDQNSHSESGDTDFFTPEQSPSKLGFVGVQQQQQQQDNGNQDQLFSHEPPQIQVQPASPSPQAGTSGGGESDSEDDSEQGVSLRQQGTVESPQSLPLPLPPPPSSVSVSPSEDEAAAASISNTFSHRPSTTSGLELLPSPFSYSPTSELRADRQEQHHPTSPAAQPEHRTVSLPLRLLLDPSEIQTPAVMSQPNNNSNSSADAHGQNMTSLGDDNQHQQAANPTMPQTSSVSPNLAAAHGQADPATAPRSATAHLQTALASTTANNPRPASPQAPLTEEQVRALMMEDDDFDPIPAEYRHDPSSHYMPQVSNQNNAASGHASASHPHNTQAYNTGAQHQPGMQYMGGMYNGGQGVYSPHQHGGYPEYVGAYGYGFPQYYPGFNNPLFADPRLAYTPPVGPRAQMAGHLDTPPVGPPAHLAHPTGTVPYAQSPFGYVGVGGSPSRNHEGQSHSPQRVVGVTHGGARGYGGVHTVNQSGGVSVAGNRPGSRMGHGHDVARGRTEAEDGDADVVGGVALGGNGGNN